MDRSLKGKNPVPGPTLRHLFTVPGWWTLPRCQGLSIEYYRGSHVGVILVSERWNSSKHSWMKMVPTLVTRDSRRFLQDTPWWRSLRRSSWKRRKEPQDRHSVSPLCPEGKRIAPKKREKLEIWQTLEKISCTKVIRREQHQNEKYKFWKEILKVKTINKKKNNKIRKWKLMNIKWLPRKTATSLWL